MRISCQTSCLPALLSPRVGCRYNHAHSTDTTEQRYSATSMAFWRRKTSDRYITLGLNEPLAPQTEVPPAPAELPAPTAEPPAAQTEPTSPAPAPPTLEPAVTGSAPTPAPPDKTA